MTVNSLSENEAMDFGAISISTNKLGKVSVIDLIVHHVRGKKAKASQTKR